MEIKKKSKYFFREPILLNINTNRLFWHSGAGIDSDKTFDRYKSLRKIFGAQGNTIHNKAKEKINILWKKMLGKR